MLWTRRRGFQAYSRFRDRLLIHHRLRTKTTKRCPEHKDDIENIIDFRHMDTQCFGLEGKLLRLDAGFVSIIGVRLGR